MTITRADLVWTGARFERGLQVRHEYGKIVAVEPETNEPGERLEQRALLPGFVNAHSLAFQRAMTLPLLVRAYRDMRAAGITTVGEFHCLHHAGDGDDYAHDESILDAAREAGVRIVLLNAYYRNGPQARFRSASLDAYWKQMDRLVILTEGEQRWLGAAVCGVDAVSPDDLAVIYEESRRRGLVCHMQADARLPVLLDLEVGENLTAVHGTHADPGDMRRFEERGGNVCVCPGSEESPGSGIADWSGAPALGTGSGAYPSMLDGMRRIGGNGAARLSAGTEQGGKALGVPAGRIARGFWADFVAIDLLTPSLADWSDDTLLDAFLFGAGDRAVANTCVAGRWS